MFANESKKARTSWWDLQAVAEVSSFFSIVSLGYWTVTKSPSADRVTVGYEFNLGTMLIEVHF